MGSSFVTAPAHYLKTVWLACIGYEALERHASLIKVTMVDFAAFRPFNGQPPPTAIGREFAFLKA